MGMKRIEKLKHSAGQQLRYPKDKKKIIALLLKEQGYLCAYTEARITATYAKDVEHFNPTLKETDSSPKKRAVFIGQKVSPMRATFRIVRFLCLMQPIWVQLLSRGTLVA